VAPLPPHHASPPPHHASPPPSPRITTTTPRITTAVATHRRHRYHHVSPPPSPRIAATATTTYHHHHHHHHHCHRYHHVSPPPPPLLTAVFLALHDTITVMQAGFAMVEAGSIGVTSVVSVLFKNMGDCLIGALAWFVFGWAFAYGDHQGRDPDQPTSSTGESDDRSIHLLLP
jgi:hypothetical protein